MECQSDRKESEHEYEHKQEQEGRGGVGITYSKTPSLRALFLEHPGIFAPATLRRIHHQ